MELLGIFSRETQLVCAIEGWWLQSRWRRQLPAPGLGDSDLVGLRVVGGKTAVQSADL